MTRTGCAALALLLSLAQAAAADRVVTQAGQEVSGLVELEVLVIAGDEAEIEVPRSSILEIRPSAGRLNVLLVDGSWVSGPPITPDVAIRSELYSLRFEWPDVRRVQLDLDATGSSDQGAFLRVDDLPRSSGWVERPSPLRLELDIGEVLELEPVKRAAWTSSRLRLFRSDGVSIPVVQIKKEVNKSSYVTLTLEISVRVGLSYDRMIDLELQLLADPGMQRELRESFEVEEGRIDRVEFFMHFPPQEFERWFSAEARPRLRFSLTSTES